MNFLRSYARSIGLLLSFSIFSSTFIQCYDQAFSDHVFNKYSQSFGIKEESQKEEKINLEPKNFTEMLELIKEIFRPSRFVTTELNQHDKRSLSQKAAPARLVNEDLVDKMLIDKMEVVQGESGDAMENLAARLTNKYTLLSTEFGKNKLVEILSQPTNDLVTISRRQAMLKELVANPTLLKECQEILQSVKGAESRLLSFFDTEKMKTREDIFKRPYWGNTFPFTKPLNKSTACLEVGTRLNNLNTLFNTAFPTVMALGIWATKRHEFHALPPDLKVFFGAYGVFVYGIMNLGTLTQLSMARINKNAINNMQENLIGCATCINSMRNLGSLLEANPIFAANFKNLKDLSELAEEKDHEQFNELVNLLNTNTFKGSASFFSNSGRILKAYRLMQDEEVQLTLVPALHALGELDVMVALAQKIKEHESLPVHYSFVKFVTKDKPYISATNFWNPFVDPTKVVTNTLTLGGGSNPQNIILTGPNTGGKSTLLKALMTNAGLLVHTFGIATADELVVTPFSKFTCHMNITDNTAAGISLFKAEVLRAKELITLLRTLPQNQFAFIIIDEIFTGTEPEKAEELSYKYIKQVSDNHPNCLFINATHFKKMRTLERDTGGKCKNLHMGAIVDQNGRVTKYTYKLADGPSPINNAAQIAEEENIFD